MARNLQGHPAYLLVLTRTFKDGEARPGVMCGTGVAGGVRPQPQA